MPRRSRPELALGQVSMKLGEALPRPTGAGSRGGRGRLGLGWGVARWRWRTSPGGDDKVVDADFEEVDDQKKRGSA